VEGEIEGWNTDRENQSGCDYKRNATKKKHNNRDSISHAMV